MEKWKEMFTQAKGRFTLEGLRLALNGSARFSSPTAGRLAYQLLARPRRLIFSTADEEFISDALGDVHPSEDALIQTYLWAGDGPTILLAHGWESSTARWRRQVELLLKAGFQVVALDAPVHGRSTGEHFTVIQYAKALNVVLAAYKPAAIVGHSAGGMAAVYHFSHHLEAARPGCLVLLATPGELMDFINAFGFTLRLHPHVLNALEQVFIERVDKPFSYFSISTFAQQLGDLPGLIIHDREDEVAPYTGAEAIHQNWPGSRLVTTTGLGHSLIGEEVAEMVVEFLRGQLLVHSS